MTDQPQFGAPLPGWTPPPRPPRAPIAGTLVRLEPLDADLHAADLHRAYAPYPDLWNYLPYGPFADADAYHGWASRMAPSSDPLFFALRDSATGRCGGVATYLRITPEAGSIEVGHICLAPELARGRVSTEVMFRMMQWAFDAGYRRFEWKCDALNVPSRRAAQRLGFTFEGVFRQATIVKGRNRDTAWFSVIDKEWPALKAAFGIWLSPENFDTQGQQKQRLSDLTAPVRGGSDPTLPA